MVPTREQVMRIYREFWVKNPPCICVAPHMMAAIITSELDKESGDFLPSDANMNTIKEHLADEVSQGGVYFVQRGRSAGYYRSKGHMPVVGVAKPKPLGSFFQPKSEAGEFRVSGSFGPGLELSITPTPTQAPVVPKPKLDTNSYSYLFFDEDEKKSL